MNGLTIDLLKQTAQESVPKGTDVWLYGSRARGDADDDSDWDLLIILDKPLIETDDFGRFGYPFVVMGWKYGADVSPQLYTKTEWNSRSFTPYFKNVEQDKKIVYES